MARPKKMGFTLDNEGRDYIRLEGVAMAELGRLDIYVNGYGYEGQQIGSLVMQDGKLRFVLFQDFESEEATTIEMEGARVD